MALQLSTLYVFILNINQFWALYVPTCIFACMPSKHYIIPQHCNYIIGGVVWIQVFWPPSEAGMALKTTDMSSLARGIGPMVSFQFSHTFLVGDRDFSIEE